MSRRLVVIACGASKLDHRAPAVRLYTGQHFRASLAAALSVARDPSTIVRILSAKYGLLRLDELVDPYELRMGDAGSVTGDELADQAAELGDVEHVLALCPAAYADRLAEAFPAAVVERPLAGLGIGKQRHVLAELRRQAELWLSVSARRWQAP